MIELIAAAEISAKCLLINLVPTFILHFINMFIRNKTSRDGDRRGMLYYLLMLVLMMMLA